jgi:competence protein ComEC
VIKKYDIPFWKTAPFIRLLLPFVMGIIIGWYLQIPILLATFGIVSFLIAFGLFYLLPIVIKFKIQFVQGILLNLVLIAAGMLITWQKDVRHSDSWFGNHYQNGDYMAVKIAEPVIEKTKSIKADAVVEALVSNQTAQPTTGKLLLYFSKDSTARQLQYGDIILVSKKLQAIKNSGNPGAFNYERYAAFLGIFYNVFLQPKDWVLLPQKNIDPFWQFIFTAREKILSILRTYAGSNKDELGITEALLIGYTNDLDKDLVQSYSNTGVVHIIAISGMHLGLIYVMLIWIFKRLPYIKKSKGLQVVFILGCLWLFSLLTGASASVCRAAVMFTFITLGANFFKQASIYNSLAASAFVMLCYNPYYLWDVGFQLSYLAVGGIVAFQKPIYNWFYIPNKYVDAAWKLLAISLAAQTLTFPICIYYFHQFPNMFLITNLIAVPLSSGILYAAIALIAFSWIPYVGLYLGKLVNGAVWCMNKIILWVDSLPFTLWDKIPATVLTTWLLYCTVIGASLWLLHANKNWLKFSMCSLLAFVSVHAYNNWQIQNQQKLIVYNVGQHKAIDFIKGNNYQFIGDSILLEDGLLQNFHLKPGRVALQLNNRTDSLQQFLGNGNFCQFGNQKIVMIDTFLSWEATTKPIDVDLVIVSKNPKLYINQLVKFFNCKQVVFDASNSMWKIEKWKQECDKLHLQHYSIPEKGAFIVDL